MKMNEGATKYNVEEPKFFSFLEKLKMVNDSNANSRQYLQSSNRENKRKFDLNSNFGEWEQINGCRNGTGSQRYSNSHTKPSENLASSLEDSFVINPINPNKGVKRVMISPIVLNQLYKLNISPAYNGTIKFCGYFLGEVNANRDLIIDRVDRGVIINGVHFPTDSNRSEGQYPVVITSGTITNFESIKKYIGREDLFFGINVISQGEIIASVYKCVQRIAGEYQNFKTVRVLNLPQFLRYIEKNKGIKFGYLQHKDQNLRFEYKLDKHRTNGVWVIGDEFRLNSLPFLFNQLQKNHDVKLIVVNRLRGENDTMSKMKLFGISFKCESGVSLEANAVINYSKYRNCNNMSNGYIEPIALPLNSTADVLDEGDVDMNTNDDKHNFFMNHSDDTRNTSLHGNNPEYLNNNEMDISPAVQRLVQPSLSIGVKSGSINGNPSLSSLPNSMELSIQKVSDRSDEIVQLLKEQNSLLRKNVLQSEQMAQKKHKSTNTPQRGQYGKLLNQSSKKKYKKTPDQRTPFKYSKYEYYETPLFLKVKGSVKKRSARKSNSSFPSLNTLLKLVKSPTGPITPKYIKSGNKPPQFNLGKSYRNMSSTGNRSALSNSSSSSVNKLLEKISKLEKAPARSTRSGYNNGLLPRDAYLKTNQISPTTNKYLNLLQKN